MPKVKSLIAFITNTTFLLLSVIFVYFWTNSTNLSAYSYQLIGLLVLIYFLNYFLNVKNSKNLSAANKLIDSIIFTSIILLIVTSTGNLKSPFLPLIFVLAASISLLFNFLVGIIIILSIGLFLERQTTIQGIYADFSQVIAWLFIPPMMLYIGKQYLKTLEGQQKIKILQTEEKIREEEVKHIEEDLNTFSSDGQKILNDLGINLTNLLNSPANNYKDNQSIRRIAEDLKSLRTRLQDLPDEIEQEAS